MTVIEPERTESKGAAVPPTGTATAASFLYKKFLSSPVSTGNHAFAPYMEGAGGVPVPVAGAAIIDEDQLAKTFQEIVACINLDAEEEGAAEDGSGEEGALQRIGSMGSLGTVDEQSPRHDHSHDHDYDHSHDHSHDPSHNHRGESALQTPTPTPVKAKGVGARDEDPLALSNFSRMAFHHAHHRLPTDFNTFFGGAAPFNAAVGSAKAPPASAVDAAESRAAAAGGDAAGIGAPPGRPFVGFGRSFLDDDWITSRVGLNVRAAAAANGSGPPMGILGRNGTVGSGGGGAGPGPYKPAPAPSNGTPPGDYVCNLCECAGHWLKDCRLFEPRLPGGALSSSASGRSFRSLPGQLANQHDAAGSGPGGANRSAHPPGNYVCRLCGVVGHWIDQCAKFQPKQQPCGAPGASGASGASTVSLPPMFGPGPTPNYRPPAYLSKPVPANYVCNLCHRPGHWIQQCTEFTPIINGRKLGS